MSYAVDGLQYHRTPRPAALTDTERRHKLILECEEGVKNSFKKLNNAISNFQDGHKLSGGVALFRAYHEFNQVIEKMQDLYSLETRSGNWFNDKKELKLQELIQNPIDSLQICLDHPEIQAIVNVYIEEMKQKFPKINFNSIFVQQGVQQAESRFFSERNIEDSSITERIRRIAVNVFSPPPEVISTPVRRRILSPAREVEAVLLSPSRTERPGLISPGQNVDSNRISPSPAEFRSFTQSSYRALMSPKQNECVLIYEELMEIVRKGNIVDIDITIIMTVLYVSKSIMDENDEILNRQEHELVQNGINALKEKFPQLMERLILSMHEDISAINRQAPIRSVRRPLY